MESAPESGWASIGLHWDGADGSSWNLNDREGGVVLLRNGVEGLHNPQITKHSTVAPAIPGKRSRGWRVEPREVFWPIHLWADGSDAWLERNSAFMASIHPDRAGKWTVTAGQSTRSIELTGVYDTPFRYEIDPLVYGWANYPITLEAEQPYWTGKTIRRGPWRAPQSSPFFPGPSFTISSSSAFGSATIPNPGDVDAWGVWWVDGPLDAIELGIGSALIIPPFNLPEGQTLRIDTDPRRATAKRGATPVKREDFVGDDVTSELGLQDYAPVPTGAAVDLHVNATGAGQVLFELTPLYFRAF
jgi:hypothetical protein